MKESLKRLGVKRGSVLALVIAFAVVPLPFLKGKPTGLIWSHDHASRYIRITKIDLSNHKIASIKTDYGLLKEMRTSIKFQGHQTQLYILEDKLEQLDYNDRITSKEKERRVKKLERRLDRLYDKIDTDGFKLEDIQSQNDQGLMLANQ